jgi:hypothetical protein
LGYTHTWYRPKAIDPKAYEQLKADLLKVLAVAKEDDGMVFADGGGHTPIDAAMAADALHLEPYYFDFNGMRGEGCEAFSFDRLVYEGMESKKHPGLFHQFCKTEHKPYDVAVCACLLVVKHHLPGILVYSDGDMSERNWRRAVDIANKVLGREVYPPVKIPTLFEYLDEPSNIIIHC